MPQFFYDDSAGTLGSSALTRSLTSCTSKPLKPRALDLFKRIDTHLLLIQHSSQVGHLGGRQRGLLAAYATRLDLGGALV